MNITRAYGHIIAATLLAIYLVLPATLFARSVTPESITPSVQAVVCSTAPDEPCGGCPCSDQQGDLPGCCDTVFCSCPCHAAPPGQGLHSAYAPIVVNLHVSEPFWLLPQVYRTIFVPPQNHS